MARSPLRGPEAWITAFGALLAAGGEFFHTYQLGISHQLKPSEYIEPIGLATFLAGIVFAIQRIQDRTEDIDSKVGKVGPLDAKVDRLVAQSEFAHVAELLSELASRADRQSAHIRAGGTLFRDYASVEIRTLAGHLKELAEARTVVTIKEPYFIPRLLKLMISSLDHGSTWLGVTHLTQGWEESQADPGYYEFAEEMRRKAREGALHVFRIYCVHGLVPIDAQATRQRTSGLWHAVRRDVDARIVVKVLEHDFPQDMTLVWPPCPAVQLSEFRTSTDPVKMLKDCNCDPICGMSFRTREERSLDELMICAGRSREFSDLEQDFKEGWRAAKDP